MSVTLNLLNIGEWWNLSPLSLSLTHMDHPLNVDHHNNFTLHVYVGYTFKHRVKLQEILIWSLVQRSNPLDIIKALKLVGSLSFGYYLFWTMEQNNMLTVVYKKNIKIPHFITRKHGPLMA